ncbi:MAG: inositol-3-phosphate synthase [Pseudomonadota bacterium]|nr:inositol-3-phosphate synthase [Pseudomonadota bacterium]NLX31034.1 inositol-3-phosphate synthase [Deltaproteobacteria bacterium]HNU85150.1 inositol-3-phosphate synthase [Syntrophales bacterium]HNZ34151.1 inositol-3-phosphate synthase [Syntrophales bacterium]HOF72778.1 inositol-3-phosphate synthase [Syntrophales bacterium]
MGKVRIAIAGVGNCASSLIQGIEYYRKKSPGDLIGLMHWDIGGWRPFDIEVVCAFDIDRRKVGRDVSEAIFQPPNCTAVFQPKVPKTGARVAMGRMLDSIAPHMNQYDPRLAFVPARQKEATKKDVVGALRDSGAEILLNYLPAGSEEATRFYAGCALEAGVAFINNIPVFIASDPAWARRFEKKGLPVIGDDVKSQLGATIIHRVLTHLFNLRGVKLERTYQLNTGGNTDFLNMLDRSRLKSKRISKTEAVQSQTGKRLTPENIHIGPSDWVAWQKDNKVCFLRMEGKLFGDVPMNLEMRLSVEDSPNSGGVVIDAIRCCKIALDRGIGGILHGPSAYFMKHPPRQYTDEEACAMTEAFINEAGSRRTAKG